MAGSKKGSPAPKMRPAPPEWIEAFAEAAARIEKGEQRKMFGYPALFANGNLAAGLHGDGLVLRLPEKERDALLRLPGSRPFAPMPGRIMREYVVAPPALSKRPDEVLVWVRRALAYASTLPRKPGSRGKSGKKRATRAATGAGTRPSPGATRARTV